MGTRPRAINRAVGYFLYDHPSKNVKEFAAMLEKYIDRAERMLKGASSDD